MAAMITRTRETGNDNELPALVAVPFGMSVLSIQVASASAISGFSNESRVYWSLYVPVFDKVH
jgi:hypothetical protein